jgi:hypothetical protein
MKLALQIVSWVAIVIGVLAIVGGLAETSSDPASAYYSLLGGALFATQGVLSLIYVNQHR